MAVGLTTSRLSLCTMHVLLLASVLLLLLQLPMLDAYRRYGTRNRVRPRQRASFVPRSRSGENRAALQRDEAKGPNVCGRRFDRSCCRGWTQPRSGSLCIVPICIAGCGNGQCIRPNLCLCPNTRRTAPQCEDKEQCKGGCLNGGRCIGQDRCACRYGYTGKNCEQDFRTGPCFTQVSDGMCRGQLTGVVCTKTLCCSTIGAAWGKPCEECPRTTHPCRRGYIPNPSTNTCQDVNECHAIPGLCVGGECVNTLGSYRCRCKEGQTQNPITKVCEDINECEVNPGICRNGQCTNTEGSYFCTCNSGFEPSTDRSRCVSAQVGFCYTRVAGINCQGRISERMPLRDCCCTLNMGKGWSLTGQICQPCPNEATNAHSRLCEDNQRLRIKYCEDYSNLCANGRCIDLEDSFRCECNPGYRNDSRGNCLDVNECSRQGVCRNGRCRNTEGGFECKCNEGFALSKDGTYCTDMNECESAIKMCPNGQCINMDGSYKCRCNQGFRQSPNQQVCFDINECTENGKLCHHGKCVNMEGSYRCECDPGFQLSPDGAFCHDYDECRRTSMCTNGRCQNMMGSFKCICNPGFRLAANREVCIDIDECTVNRNACPHGTCINNQGSFRCSCPRGFNLGPDGRTCQDVRRGLCYPDIRNGRCMNPLAPLTSKSACCCGRGSPGQIYGWGPSCDPCPRMEDPQFIQLCPHGKGKDFDGKDINECHQRPDICTNGACENIDMGYVCKCNDGFKSDASRLRCLDINECEVNSMLCDGGQCRNTPGSYQCICPQGHRFNHYTRMCEDLDECEGLPCIGGSCFNTKGSFKCRCPSGRILDSSGLICIDNRKGTCWLSLSNGNCENNIPGLVTQSECCGSIGKAWGSPCAPCPIQEELHCRKGFTFRNGVNCIDINECEVITNICKGGGQCVNTEGSFKCTCPQGLSLDGTGRRCVDFREGNCYQDYSRMFCSKPFMGTFTRHVCCCSAGVAWGSPCAGCPLKGTEEFEALCDGTGPGGTDEGDGPSDINECTQFPGLCVDGRCKNTVGSFECECNPGYAIDNYGTNCTDIDECRISMVDMCTPGTCVNIPGSFRCDCSEGYVGIMMDQMCVDVDECTENKALCRGGSCMNSEGSYECVCPDGHELAEDGQMCTDIDECSASSSICSNGHCENFMGGYQCICNQGYTPNDLKSTCLDNDECQDNNGGCQSVCINTPGSHSCGCKKGYLLLTDARSCVDVDECKEQPNICDGGRCDNLPGSYRCLCTGGLTASPDQQRCLDIDECLMNKNLCLNGICQNTHGSFVCKCDVGYSVKTHLRATGCTDDNECDLGISGCDENAECINTQGSFKCDCKSGYTGDGRLCTDINECVRDNGGCYKDASCINTPGSFRCICDEGFTGDGYDCQDVDECTIDPGLCENGQCFNFDGGYRCECDMGFAPTEDEGACVDIDECSMFRNLCVNGRCENVFGLFRCNCDQGYKLDSSGGNCTDIDECENSDNCQYGTCVNQRGTYICQCPPNYESNPTGTGCIDKRIGSCYMDVPLYSSGRSGVCNDKIAEDVSRASCCCTVGRGWGEVIGFCDPCPRNGTAEAANLCPGGPGFKPNLVTLVLEDIDECTEIEGICKHGDCQNSFGSYSCICRTGFRIDPFRKSCVDIDECAEDPYRCGVGRCINTDGSAQCVCPDGYILMDDGETCMDMRKGNCYKEYVNVSGRPGDLVCSRAISTIQTRFQCCCLFGAAWGEPCSTCPSKNSKEFNALCQDGPVNITDINECSINPDLCKNGRCIDLTYSFRCECFNGYVYDNLGQVCEDENECLRQIDPCMGNAQCINLPGLYQCGCPGGYRLMHDGRRCHDIDECQEVSGVCANGDCLNLEGSFSCICNRGFRLSPTRNVCVDVNECESRPGLCRNGSCTNGDGTYTCKCNTGFTLTSDGDCADINECIAMIGICTNGRCINTQGSFTCQCPEGYTLSKDRQNCRDIDECYELRAMCERGTCQNTEGTFICNCPKGYRLSPDKKTCLDINECVDLSNACFEGECQNTVGGFMCICPAGFEVSADGMSCLDFRPGSCFEGFEQGRCIDPRASNLTRSECCCTEASAWSYQGICYVCPLQGEVGFKYLCPEDFGYKPTKGGIIADINECKVHPGICINGICINNDGSFRCECGNGFTLDASGRRCIDKDECQDSNMCGNGTCENTDGSFDCSCNLGFEPGPFEKCVDINECRTSLNQCAFRCTNLPGTFKCICPMGYKVAADQIHCEDVDECSTPANKCRYECKNGVGSFKCVCPEGYTQIGQDQCRDIDECRRQPGICQNGRCINSQGGHRCSCNPGFQRSVDGKSCYDRRLDYCYLDLIGGRCIDSPDLARLTKAECCCALSPAWGQSCERCPPVNSNAFNRLCPQGPGITPEGKDIDECARMPGACKNGRCLNTMGSYRCVCNRGYKTDITGKKCIDINECRQDPKPCEFTCSNTEGSFICGCPPGYVLNSDGLTCRDMDECTTMRHDCSGTCINTPGSFTCECPSGMRKIRGNGCEDINECVESPRICGAVGTCQNTRGSYQCTCPRGYRRDKTGTTCIDIDECEGGKCEGECENMVGSFRCECPPGFTLRPGGHCIDENECTSDYVCGFTALCINLPGSFDCQCGGNMEFNIDSLNCEDGNVCGSHPCLFGCTPSSGGNYVCGCPPGYEPIGKGHCISTSTTSTTYPPGVSLPHEPGPNTDGNLPPGEGCYQCDHDFGEIPLSKGRRQKRSATRRFREAFSLEELVEYYAGTVGLTEVGKAGESIRKKRSAPSRPKPTKILPENTSNTTLVNLMTKSETETVLMYFTVNETKSHTKLLKMIPALSALQHNIQYEIVSGNEEGYFDMHKRRGVSSLTFTRHVDDPQTFHLLIECRPFESDELIDDKVVHLDSYILKIEIRVVKSV